MRLEDALLSEFYLCPKRFTYFKEGQVANGQDEPTAGEAAGLEASAGAADTPAEEAVAPKPPTVRALTVDQVNGLRLGIKVAAARTQMVKAQVAQAQIDHSTEPHGNLVDNDSEFYANMTLAYRHMEDASMRLGKAIQAADGGVSVYDRETTVGA